MVAFNGANKRQQITDFNFLCQLGCVMSSLKQAFPVSKMFVLWQMKIDVGNCSILKLVGRVKRLLVSRVV